jgi:hypothetical protein
MSLSHLFNVDKQVFLLQISFPFDVDNTGDSSLFMGPTTPIKSMFLSTSSACQSFSGSFCSSPIFWAHFRHRSAHALVAPLPMPSFMPTVHYAFNDYLVFDLNYATIHAALYLVYYFILDPVAAVRNSAVQSAICLDPL